jgi:hypothetical protein
MHLPQLRSGGPMSLLQTPINASRQLEALLTCELPMCTNLGKLLVALPSATLRS